MRAKRPIPDRPLKISDKHSDPTEARKSSSVSNQSLLSQLGASHALPESVQAKMSESFHTDFSDVRLFESPIVSDNGAEAVASGKNIAFAPGQMDFTSSKGLGLLGHELSHIASQARGEVSGSGFVNDSALEHKADIEGAQAASAFDALSGQSLTPLNAGSAPASSSAPMQAKKHDYNSKEMGQQSSDALEEMFLEGNDDPDTLVDALLEHRYYYDRAYVEKGHGPHKQNIAIGNDLEDKTVETIYKSLGHTGNAPLMGKVFQTLKNRRETYAKIAMEKYQENKDLYGDDEAEARTLYSDEIDQFTNVQELVKGIGMSGAKMNNKDGILDAVEDFSDKDKMSDTVSELYNNVVLFNPKKSKFAMQVGKNGKTMNEQLKDEHTNSTNRRRLNWKRSWLHKKKRGRV